MYASQILKISVYYLAKLSLTLVFVRLTPSNRMRRLLWAFIAVMSLWTGVALITHADQCPSPKPWDISASGCVNQVRCTLVRARPTVLT